MLYTAYIAPHWLRHAKPQDIAKYRGRFREGWDVLREKQYRRMREIGVLDEQWDMSPRGEGIPPWDELPAEKQDEFENPLNR